MQFNAISRVVPLTCCHAAVICMKTSASVTRTRDDARSHTRQLARALFVLYVVSILFRDNATASATRVLVLIAGASWKVVWGRSTTAELTQSGAPGHQVRCTSTSPRLRVSA
ncbi:hypothetical protein EDB83DRAFT_82999 [Lactarius deliciosus]|nr:hypothetical protein EDB83DRAFT_82999 [Lactarius deliciosus]